MSTNDHPDQETERTQLRVRHRKLQPQVGRRGDLSATASGDVVSPAFTPIRNTTFRTTSVNRPETSSSPWHDVSTNVAYGRPHGCTATGLAASPAMGEGTTRDHFGREAAAVITSAKGDTEAATRPTPEHDGPEIGASLRFVTLQRTGHTTTAARDRRLMLAETIRPPAHGRRGTSGLVLSLLGVRIPPGGVEV